LSALAAIALAPQVAAGVDPWEVNEQQKSMQLIPITSAKIEVENQGSRGVVVRVTNPDGTSTDYTVKGGASEEIPVPAGATVHVIRDGADAHGCWRPR
jgi:hypothetical protein